MRWTERQQAMLQAMGVRLFAPATRQQRPQPPADPPTPPPLAAVRRAAPAVAAAPELAASAAPHAPHPPQRADVAALDWPALREAVASCRACKLCESRRQTVFGVGHPRAHWMIVGEAPGEQEDRQGEPFVGPAGQLLDNMLRALGLTRGEAPAAKQVFIANPLKCRPPKNRNPEAAETAQCAPFLERQIALVQPRVILAMGRFAAQALLASDEPLGRLRGRVHRYHGVPVVVTYHPAYLLRTPTDKARAWEDLCLAASVVAAAAEAT